MSHTPRNSEPIPGYAVKERIGVGGYGEVWSAQAPGGLTKAIKFVYGYFDDARASRELKALDRIKQVRHPFLLSLERFEIVDGQLIIVTELADMSLKDRYEQVRQAGADGIGREELLRYLRDAADALDYMNESYSLQHLDVKPENLLLVGGHVKVADFGLVKDLQHDATASLMGGLTPIYAAPEVFDDRPSQRSDQYSLAIVYQEMLTGHLPFPGRTPAQLASQHMHASPRLNCLPAHDQTVIARALSKNPVDRFASCRAMVDALSGIASSRPDARERRPACDTTPIKSATAKTDSDGSHRVGSAPPSHTLMREGDAAPLSESRCAAAMAHMQLAEPIAELGPLETLNAAGGTLRPTLFLGVGGTGGHVLRRLRRTMGDRFGAADRLPSMRTLLLDTDAKFLYQVTEGENGTSLSDRETLALPLRGAQDYTSDKRDILGWLSRRWLYNIPRSLQTEGRRPLGRLALVDHASQVVERIRGALDEMLSAEALAASAEAAGCAFQAEAPRVILVASVSGGTGGGMVLDVAYTVRALLKARGCSDEGVCLVLTHSTDRNTAAAELATANAYATLKELQHYREFGYSPGSNTCGLPEPENGALPNVYLVPLGRELNDDDYEAATERIASYLYLNAATPAGMAIDLCRQATAEEAAEVSLRGFGIVSIGSLQTTLPQLATDLLCHEIVDHWRGSAQNRRRERQDPPAMFPAPSDPPSDAATVEAYCRSLRLDLAGLRERVLMLIEKELGGDADTLYARLRARRPGGGAATAQATQVLQAIRELFEPPTVGADGLKIPMPSEHIAMERGLKQVAAVPAESLKDLILRLVDDPAARLGAAVRMRDQLAAYLKAVDGEVAALNKETNANIQALEQAVLSTQHSAAPRSRMFGAKRAEQKQAAELEGMLELAMRLRLQAFTLTGIAKIIRLLGSSLTAAGDQIKDLQRELGQWRDQFENDYPWNDDDDAPPEAILEQVEDALAQQLRQRLPELAARIDSQIHNTFLSQHGGLRTICQKAEALRPAMLAALRAEARAEVLSELKKIALTEAVLGSDGNETVAATRLTSCRELARPTMLDCGGSQRMLAIVPQGDANARLRDALSELLEPAPTIVVNDEVDLVLCYEQQELSLPHVAARLIAGRDDYREIAGRLHTRTDVSWRELPLPSQPLEKPAAPLAPQPAPLTPASAVAEEPGGVTMTQPVPR